MLACSVRGRPRRVSIPRRSPHTRPDTSRGLNSGRDGDLASRLHLRPLRVSPHSPSAPSHVRARLEHKLIALRKFRSTPCGSQPAASAESPSVARLTLLRCPFPPRLVVLVTLPATGRQRTHTLVSPCCCPSTPCAVRENACALRTLSRQPHRWDSPSRCDRTPRPRLTVLLLVDRPAPLVCADPVHPCRHGLPSAYPVRLGSASIVATPSHPTNQPLLCA